MEKIDIHDQIMMNIDIITDIFYKWFYRYSFGKIKPNKITKYYITNKFIKSFDETV